MRRSVSPLSVANKRNLFSAAFNKEDIFGKKEDRSLTGSCQNTQPLYESRSSLDYAGYKTQESLSYTKENAEGTIERLSLMNFKPTETHQNHRVASFGSQYNYNRGPDFKKSEQNSAGMKWVSEYADIEGENSRLNGENSKSDQKYQLRNEYVSRDKEDYRDSEQKAKPVDQNPFINPQTHTNRASEMSKASLEHNEHYKNIEKIESNWKEFEKSPQFERNYVPKREDVMSKTQDMRTAAIVQDYKEPEYPSHVRRSKRTHSELRIEDLSSYKAIDNDKSRRVRELDIEDLKHKYNRMKDYYKTQLKRMSEELTHYKDLYEKVTSHKELERVRAI